MLAIQLPEELQQRFVQSAQALYGEAREGESTQKALIEAVENWLRQHEEELSERERQANRAAYERLQAAPEPDSSGKWAVIALGKLQGIFDTRDEALLRLTEIRDARERLLFQIGVHLGEADVQLPFDIWVSPSAGIPQTSLR